MELLKTDPRWRKQILGALKNEFRSSGLTSTGSQSEPTITLSMYKKLKDSYQEMEGKYLDMKQKLCQTELGKDGEEVIMKT